MFELTAEKQRLLETDGHILTLGGPGSGKTTIALLKAKGEIGERALKHGQRLLFLSFARATVARVAEQAGEFISRKDSDRLEISTYHGFAWDLIRSHGYLLKGTQRIRLLPPPEAASRLAEIDGDDARTQEKERLFREEGLLHFDLFARKCAELLTRCRRLTAIVSDSYPTIILDEFQDTNADEWQVIQVLGARSRLVALADPEQRIYEFRGADPRRITEFATQFRPTQFDFGTENNRSNGTDIVTFGNDLLTGANRAKAYRNVTIDRYPFRKGVGMHLEFKAKVIERVQHLRRANPTEWSVAVLVPTKSLMLDVATYLENKQVFPNGGGFPVLPHEVALETAGPALAASIIAGVVEGSRSAQDLQQRLVSDLCNHLRGRKGDEQAGRGQLELAGALGAYCTTGRIRGKNRLAIAADCMAIAESRMALQFSGDPEADWLAVRRLFERASTEPLSQVAYDARYLRLLHKGAQLRSRLSAIWRKSGEYVGAAAAVQAALLQEHFATSTKTWRGVHVMTIHKSKGKEFDEVIVYEGAFQGRIVRPDADPRRKAQSRLALRVAVTRARRHATILTPAIAPCEFL